MVRWTRHMLMLLAMFFAYLDESNGQANVRKPQLGGGPPIPSKGYLVEEIRDGLYWLSDGAYNTMFLVTSDGVISVDAPPTLGANYLKAIAGVTQEPIKYLIYSHEHTDHIGAAYLFPKDVRIVAQQETAEILAQRNDPRRPPPTITFSDKYRLEFGGQTLILEYSRHQSRTRKHFHLRSKTKGTHAGGCGLSRLHALQKLGDRRGHSGVYREPRKGPAIQFFDFCRRPRDAARRPLRR